MAFSDVLKNKATFGSAMTLGISTVIVTYMLKGVPIPDGVLIMFGILVVAYFVYYILAMVELVVIAYVATIGKEKKESGDTQHPDGASAEGIRGTRPQSPPFN